jgi:hypothetical protein
MSDATAKPKHAQDKGKGNQSNADKGHKGKDHKVDKANKAHKKHKHDKHAKFEDNDRKAILNIFRAPDGRKQLPPGLAKNLKRGKPLPPGWQKKLNPGYRIENEIWNAFTPISYDMVPNAKRHPNAQLYYHDNKVYRVLNATREILDVMSVK